MESLQNILATVLIAFNVNPVLAQELPADPPDTISISQPVITESKFTEKFDEQIEIIPKKTVYNDDPEVEAGIETVLDEGSDGKVVKTIKIIYYNANTSEVGFDSSQVEKLGEEYSQEIISTQTISAVDRKISRGTKIIWKTLDTEGGQISYWKKMRVYATHYDSRCLGCNDWTAIGIRAGKGVIAVDPKVIKLRSKVYIPGYGTAIAGDTGGAIKGNIIDLGFEDARTAGWSARFVDIYLL